MDDSLRQTVFETLSEVFETMYFTFLEPVADLPAGEEAVTATQVVEAAISYSGPHAGGFRFYVPLELARNITLNFLGIDDVEVSEAQILDTVKETANMAVGSLLGKLDPSGASKLAIPEARVIDDFQPAALLGQPGLFLFNTENGLLWVVHEEGAAS